MRLPYHHRRAQDGKSVVGKGDSLTVDGIVTGLCYPVPTRTELGVESDLCQQAHCHTPVLGN
jgi:hypothetical protein